MDKRHARTFPLVAGLAIAVAVLGVLRSDHDSAAAVPLAEAEFAAEFDGLDFTGTLQSADGSIVLDDTLHFRDGHFWSGGCVRCSFLPGQYWTRTASGEGEFFGILESPERGRFTYRGRIAGGTVRAEIRWVRERWYWTMERDYLFVGEVMEAEASDVTLPSAWNRALDLPAPTCPI